MICHGRFVPASGQNQPVESGIKLKTSHFEERIAVSAVSAVQKRDESTQRELKTISRDPGGV